MNSNNSFDSSINTANIDLSGGAYSNTCRNDNLDILFGFQDIDPMLLTTFTEILGNIMAGNLPTNVTDALGNWLQLVSAIISTYISQQQYQQSGPGRYYNPVYRNVTNPFCSNPSISDDNNLSPSKKSKHKHTNDRIRHLEYTVNNLLKEIQTIKKQ